MRYFVSSPVIRQMPRDFPKEPLMHNPGQPHRQVRPHKVLCFVRQCILLTLGWKTQNEFKYCDYRTNSQDSRLH